MRLIERILAEIAIALFRSWNSASIIGIDNIPRHGKFIAASNHLSYLDPVLILSFLYKIRPVAPIATMGLFRFPLKTLLRSTNAVSVERGSIHQRRFLRDALGRLEKRPLLIFPEGGIDRYAKGRKVPGGAGYLALKSQCPVVPLRVKGTDKALPPGSVIFKRQTISIHIGSPMVLADKGRSYSDIAEDIMARIYSL